MLGLLAEGAAHPFALGRDLAPGGALGRVLTVRRPLVYRAVDRLSESGLIAAERTEPGSAGPERTVYRITGTGRRRLGAWLEEPVRHVRDVRLTLLLKLVLIERAGGSPAGLLRDQKSALADAFEALAEPPETPDVVDLWRHHAAAAAAAFLDAAARGSGGGTVRSDEG